MFPSQLSRGNESWTLTYKSRNRKPPRLGGRLPRRLGMGTLSGGARTKPIRQAALPQSG
jgi:hypothetical protein